MPVGSTAGGRPPGADPARTRSVGAVCGGATHKKIGRLHTAADFSDAVGLRTSSTGKIGSRQHDSVAPIFRTPWAIKDGR